MGATRHSLFVENPHCYYCGVLTRIDILPPNPIAATLEHLYPRLHPLRHSPNKPNEKRRVLACFKCNNEKSVRDQIDFLGLEGARMRGMGPRNRLEWLKSLGRDLKRFDCF